MLLWSRIVNLIYKLIVNFSRYIGVTKGEINMLFVLNLVVYLL